MEPIRSRWCSAGEYALPLFRFLEGAPIMRRIVVVSIIVLLSVSSFVPGASAGGWAAVVLTDPLQEVVTGEETTIEFQVQAHARPEAAMPGMETSFLFLHESTGFFVAVDGEATADPETYAITFTLDQPGEWEARAMIHNFGDIDLLTKFPTVVASGDLDVART
jgi:hypothetical protein